MEQYSVTAETAGQTEQQGDPDAALLQAAWENFRNEQNLVMGLLAGLLAALVGAGIWAGLAALTGYMVGWVAVGIGFAVGFAVRFGGKGLEKSFGFIGAALAGFSCALGNLLIVSHFVGLEEGLSFFGVLSLLTPQIVMELMVATFSPMDLLFYGLAIYTGYKYSIRQISEAELAVAIKGSGARM